MDFPECTCGEWYVSSTRFGPMVHARLGVAAENSGKLVSAVRQRARRIAEERGLGLLLTDGPPGIGCPVIASVTGTDALLAVTEPTLAAEHDLERLLGLARHFKVRALVCVNRWDINPKVAERIERRAAESGAEPVGRIPYDRAVTAAQVQGRAVVECGDGPAAAAIREVWEKLAGMLEIGRGT
jgi:MinD superfamily P-loop ATPase